MPLDLDAIIARVSGGAKRPAPSSVGLPDLVHDLFVDQTDEGRDEWLTPQQLLDYAQDHALNEWNERDYRVFEQWRGRSESAALAEAAKWVRARVKSAPPPLDRWSVARAGYEIGGSAAQQYQGYVADSVTFTSKQQAIDYARSIGGATVVQGTQMVNEPMGQVEEHGGLAWHRYYSPRGSRAFDLDAAIARVTREPKGVDLDTIVASVTSARGPRQEHGRYTAELVEGAWRGFRTDFGPDAMFIMGGQQGVKRQVRRRAAKQKRRKG